MKSSHRKFLALIFVLVLVFVAGVFAFIAGVSLNSGAAFTLAGISLSLFVAIYAVGILGYRAGGGGISLEVDHRLSNLEQSRDELKKVATSLSKALHVVIAKSGGLSGMHNDHVRLIEKYLDEARPFIQEGARELVELEMRPVVKQPAS